MILIFSNKQDIHCNPVIHRLTDRGEAFLRINTEALLTDYRFAFHVEGDGEPYAWIHCVPNGITADTRDVKAVWDRRASRPDSLPGDGSEHAMDGELRRVALEEGSAFARWLRYFLGDRFTIGSPAGDPPAESKFLQARVAWDVLKECGLHGDLSLVPTTVGNDHGRFEALLRPIEVAIKPLTADGISAGEKYPFLTQRRPAAELREAPPGAFAACPTQLQPYVEKAFEARITAVGRQRCSPAASTRPTWLPTRAAPTGARATPTASPTRSTSRRRPSSGSARSTSTGSAFSSAASTSSWIRPAGTGSWSATPTASGCGSRRRPGCRSPPPSRRHSRLRGGAPRREREAAAARGTHLRSRADVR